MESETQISPEMVKATLEGFTHYLPKYKDVWNNMDIIDGKHADSGTPIRVAETKVIISYLKAFHFHCPITIFNKSYHEKISKMIEKIEDNYDAADSITMNVLKDHIHSMWLMGFPEPDSIDSEFESKTEYEYDDDNFSTFTKISEFTRDEFRDLYTMPHTKEGFDRTFHGRYYFFANLLRVVNPDLEGCFGSFMHDIQQESNISGRNAQHLKILSDAFEKDLITKKQYVRLVRIIGEAISKSSGTGRWTWGNDEWWISFHEEYFAIKKALRNFKKSGLFYYDDLNCHSRNCKKMHRLLQTEIDDFQNGLGLPVFYCEDHQKFYDNGHKHGNRELTPFNEHLPETYPITLRVFDVANEDHRKGIKDRMLDYVNSSKDIKLIYPCVEKYPDGDSDEVLYISVETKQGLENFLKTFRDDYGMTFSAIEIDSEVKA